MAVDKQLKNLAAVIRASGQFTFSANTTTLSAAQAAGFRDLGNISSLQINSQSKKDYHLGSYNGIRRRDKTFVNEIVTGYKVKADELSIHNIKFPFYGTQGTNYSQSARAVVAVDALSSPAKDRWYFLQISGVRHRNLTAVSIVMGSGSVTEDLDYVIDYKTGRIRWLITPGAITSISISCPAILTTDNAFYTTSVGDTPIYRGVGTAELYDSDGNFIMEHPGFYCEVTNDSQPEFDGQKDGEIALEVNIITNLANPVWAV